jgi:protein KRI1
MNVKPESYGLSDEQILFGDDKELNRYVSIKKLVPYREEKMKLRNNIYKKKVKTINKSVSENKKLVEKEGVERRLKKSRVMDKMKRRAEVMRNKREGKLKILNISNPHNEKRLFVPSSRLASYGVSLEKTL